MKSLANPRVSNIQIHSSDRHCYHKEEDAILKFKQ